MKIAKFSFNQKIMCIEKLGYCLKKLAPITKRETPFMFIFLNFVQFIACFFNTDTGRTEVICKKN